MATPDQGRTAVYRLFDVDNELLYVGITNHTSLRLAGHASDKDWWPQVWIREVEWFPTRLEAEHAEARAIAEEGPKYNKSAGVTRERAPLANGTYWTPDSEFKRLVQRHARAERALTAARSDLERAIVDRLKGGAAARYIAECTPWSVPMIYALGKRAGIPRRRQPTLLGERERAMRDARKA
jgi:hypothetical protein